MNVFVHRDPSDDRVVTQHSRRDDSIYERFPFPIAGRLASRWTVRHSVRIFNKIIYTGCLENSFQPTCEDGTSGTRQRSHVQFSTSDQSLNRYGDNNVTYAHVTAIIFVNDRKYSRGQKWL